MINEDMSREAENVSSIRKQPLLNYERKGMVRLRLNALGDVQNTIHSRPVNSGLSNTNAFVKSSSQIKLSASPKLHHQKENPVSKSCSKTKCEKTLKPAASESGYRVPTFEESDLVEIHNHSLCEQDEQTRVRDLFLEYKFDKSQIETLAKSVKRYRMSTPVLRSLPSVVPCADIEIPKSVRCDATLFCINDILDDLVFPDVPPPPPLLVN